MKTGYIHSLESFATQDGPGIRYLIFFQGCPLRCKYCQNPDTWELKEGKEVSVEELISKILNCKSYFNSKGGVTVSGGEPTLQFEFLLNLLKSCKEEGINTALDTSGYVDSDRFEKLLPYLDLVLLDIKGVKDDKHQDLTGVSNKKILNLLELLEKKEQKFWLRYVVVPGVTDKLVDLEELIDLLAPLEYLERVELLAYHRLGVHKWEELGLDYQLSDIKPPAKDDLEEIKKLFIKSKIDTVIK